jgi:hypothetical protein
VAASVQQVQVSSQRELESTITSYIAQGFVVSNRSPDSVTLFKKKEFNVIWAIVGFFLCLLPLIVYCIVYATQSDQMVMVTVTDAHSNDELTWSKDRQWWWDGQQWRDTLVELPPGIVLSDDKDTWWDGETWRPMPASTGAAERGTEAARPAPEPPAAHPGSE